MRKLDTADPGSNSGSQRAQNRTRNCNYYWRLFATALSFTVFGVVGVLLTLLALPIRLIPMGAARRARLTRGIVYVSFGRFIWMMRVLGIFNVTTQGLEKLNRPQQLVLPCHPTLLDTVFLMSMIRGVSGIVKHTLWSNPAMGGTLRNANYVSNRNPQQMIADSVSAIRGGDSLLMFPEGTRSRPGEPITLQRGAANIALGAQCTVTPVAITCVPITLTKREPWYSIPWRKADFLFTVGDDIDLTPYLAEPSKSKAARAFNRDLLQWYETELEGHARWHKSLAAQRQTA